MPHAAFHPSTLPSCAHPALQQYREAALAHFVSAGLPHKRQEPWKYTSLGHLDPGIFLPSLPISDLTCSESLHYALPDAHQIIFVDGALVMPPALSSFIKPLSEACTEPSSVFGKAVHALLASRTPVNSTGITSLNNAYAQEGYVLVLPEQYDLSTPLDIHYLQNTASCHTQCFIFLNSGSRAIITEHFYGTDPTSLYQHHVSRIQLRAHAQLHHYRLQHMPLSCTHLYTQDTHLEKHSHYFHLSLNTGSKLARHELSASLNGEKSNCTIESITLAKEGQHLDTYIPIHHTAGKTYSQQHIRQVLKENAKGIFYGNVTIDPDCPKSESHQLCHSMLLGNKAQAFARPELDILTDDVICSHGATMGALDENALYYLQSRGLDQKQATALLLEAFIQQILEKTPHLPVARILQDHIHSWSLLP